MRFLFSLRNQTLLSVFEAPIRGLCEAGDEVLIVLESKLDRPIYPLEAGVPGVTIRGEAEPDDAEPELGPALRVWIDYLRYFDPELSQAAKYRDRSGRPLPVALREQTDRAARSPELLRGLRAGLRAVERTLPVRPQVAELLEQTRPDAVLVSPLLKRGSPQVCYLRAARALGIPSALCVASWDNLTTTGLIHELPDLVTVWNDAQRQEAIRLHAVPPERLAVTGAPRFDAWFGRVPRTSRKEYCKRLGLPDDRQHILYVGSHKFTAPDEADWIARWLSGVRRSGPPELRDAPIVIRPHPGGPLDSNPESAQRLSRMRGVVVHPPGGSHVFDEATLSNYFDSIHHAAAVVGVNTSAMIEAAVVGRPVHVLLANRYRATQDESPHFNHLRSAGGGLIVATEDREEHAAGLARSLRGEDREEAAARARSFLASFVRPHGLDRPAAPLMVDALRQLAAGSRRPAGPELGDVVDELTSLLLPD